MVTSLVDGRSDRCYYDNATGPVEYICIWASVFLCQADLQTRAVVHIETSSSLLLFCLDLEFCSHVGLRQPKRRVIKTVELAGL